jgi:hypothetical protein
MSNKIIILDTFYNKTIIMENNSFKINNKIDIHDNIKDDIFPNIS